jgi:hypothetical protein
MLFGYAWKVPLNIGEERRTALANWKLRLVGGLTTVEEDELPRKVVQRRPQIVHCIAKDRRPPKRRER